MMVRPHFQPDRRLPGFGLGFFRVDIGGQLAVEHQGVLPGFNSQIFLTPNHGLGVLAFTNGSKQAMSWLPAEIEELLSSLVGAPAAVIRTMSPIIPRSGGISAVGTSHGYSARTCRHGR
jgi:hypothetical protein